VPAVAIDGKLAECCTGRGINVQVLRAAGLLVGSAECPRFRATKRYGISADCRLTPP
jgi:hypothetical protein